MDDKNNIKNVAQSIINLADHGEDCFCSHCQMDYKLIGDNPKSVSNLAPMANFVIKSRNSEIKNE